MRPVQGPSIREFGENRIVARFRSLASAALRNDVLVGPGDDAAVLMLGDGPRLLLACDMMVEGTHFRLEWATPWQIGWKAMVQNLSDIAAMGGDPSWAVASLAASGDAAERAVEGIAEGLIAAASRHGAALVGGDVVGSPGPLVVDVAITGSVEKENLLLRSGAQPGDAVLVTGSLGVSAAGLAARQRGLPQAEDAADVALAEALRAHHEPRPRLVEARSIADTRLATAMMDLSDGLAEDLPRLCAASGVGARVLADEIPIARPCSALAGRLGLDALDLAITGGEDYELLLTCPRDRVEQVRAAVSDAAGTPVTPIGDVVAEEEQVVLVDSGGRSRPLGSGFDHFAVPSAVPEQGDSPSAKNF